MDRALTEAMSPYWRPIKYSFDMSEKKRWLIVVLFAAAMAWVESALVVDLRTLVNRLEPYQANPLPDVSNLGEVELIREFATLIMLCAVGWLAGQTRERRWGYTFLAFGVWDILYYVFLKVIIDWPRSLWDWDILFLLPLPWWGPVFAPMLIAALMIIFGSLVTQFGDQTHRLWPSRRAWIFNLSGCVLALLVFMSDAIRAVEGGVDALRQVLPVWFNWPVFIIALILMAIPLLEISQKFLQGAFRKEKRNLVAEKNNPGAKAFFVLLLCKLISHNS
ncbi:hypothetical protein HUU05_10870 [candidate division KSB1 bacterium]|nr:hypothetical protein [candidate division KSB1 bacterium]